ncbi:hypothetical protein Afil01_67810 [Actinorhabdospora filicis]|uniref:NB-ARC domain-containing protein n=1 Tax=Actinorhabdospora filicis TaxID=1785913 RepID=A0A9W6SSA7_9ACTN|nr:tetratricopeptide repeat protein [Actinorhabdospora filicis]GLZ81974.1 hypothetical protein Afil01_67810 [Actinorhabdospora filicis]
MSPDPVRANDPAAFIALLAELRDWAGRPSLRELRQRGGTTTAPNGDVIDALPPSTVSYVLRGERLPSLPRRSFVEAYVAACLAVGGLSGEEIPPVVARWAAAWRELRGGGRRPSLPRDLPDFTGREAELRTVEAHLTGSSRIVVVDGMAGVGKTSFAVRVAHRLAPDFDDVVFLDLHGHRPDRPPREPLDALGTLLRASGLDAAKVPADADEAAVLWRSRTASGRLLVVLDDCRDAALAEPLLPSGPDSAVLVTSRRRLGLDGARSLSLGVLSAAEAAEMLARIADRKRVTAEPEVVDTLVARVGALPLALRVVGARLQHRPDWPVAAFVEQLPEGNALARLADADRSVAAAFEASYVRLPESARRTFRLLGAHPGELGLDVAAALSGRTPDAAWADLELLSDANMVQRPHPERYRVHDLLAAFARAHGGEREMRAAVGLLLSWYLHSAWRASLRLSPRRRPLELAGEAVSPFDPADRAGALAWFDLEHPNLVAAVGAAARAGLHRHAWQIAISLMPFLETRGLRADWITTHLTGLDSARAVGDRPAEALLLTALGIARRGAGRFEEAVADWEAALVIREELGDELGAGLALNNLGAGYSSLGRTGDAMDVYERSLAIWVARDDASHQGMALTNIADLHRLEGRYGECVAAAGRAAELAVECADVRAEAIARHNLGRGLAGLGRHEDALDAFDRALALLREIGERWGIAATQRFRGVSRQALGKPAEEEWEEALRLFTEIGDAQAGEVRALLGK